MTVINRCDHTRLVLSWLSDVTWPLSPELVPADVGLVPERDPIEPAAETSPLSGVVRPLHRDVVICAVGPVRNS